MPNSANTLTFSKASNDSGRVLSGSAIIRVSVLLLLAGALAALVQYLMPLSQQVQVATPARTAEPAPAPPTVRKIPPAPPPQPHGEAAPTVIPAPAPDSVAPQPAPTTQVEPPPPPAPEQKPGDAASFPAPAPTAAAQGEAEVERAENTEGPPAIALVDLNTASVAELNHLRGGGNIGRAIIAKRPYAQVSDLLTKRVLSRAVYERIKEQVMVR